MRASRATRRTKQNRDVGGVGPDFVDHILKLYMYNYYVCIYVYVYVYVYAYAYAYVYVYVYVYVCIVLLVTCRNFPKHRRTMAL